MECGVVSGANNKPQAVPAAEKSALKPIGAVRIKPTPGNPWKCWL